MQTLFDAAKAVYAGDLDGARAALDDMRKTNFDVLRARMITGMPSAVPTPVDAAVQDRLEVLMKDTDTKVFGQIDAIRTFNQRNARRNARNSR